MSDEKIKLFQFYSSWQTVLSDYIVHGQTNLKKAIEDPTFVERLILYLTIDHIRLNSDHESYSDIKNYILDVLDHMDQSDLSNVSPLADFLPRSKDRIISNKNNVIKVDFRKPTDKEE